MAARAGFHTYLFSRYLISMHYGYQYQLYGYPGVEDSLTDEYFQGDLQFDIPFYWYGTATDRYWGSRRQTTTSNGSIQNDKNETTSMPIELQNREYIEIEATRNYYLSIVSGFRINHDRKDIVYAVPIGLRWSHRMIAAVGSAQNDYVHHSETWVQTRGFIYSHENNLGFDASIGASESLFPGRLGITAAFVFEYLPPLRFADDNSLPPENGLPTHTTWTIGLLCGLEAVVVPF